MCCLDCEDLKLLSVYNISKAGEWNINGGKMYRSDFDIDSTQWNITISFQNIKYI